MLTPVTEDLFYRYAHSNVSPADAATVWAWLQDPANQDQAHQWMRQHWEAMPAGPAQPAVPNEPDYEALLGALHQRLDFSDQRELAPQAAPLWWRWAAAAALAGAVAGGSWLFRAQRALPPIEVATKYGEVQHIKLPDGSEITLNGHSKLRYAAKWSLDKPREVWLDGEAYFAVRHQPNNQHFIVHTQAGFSVEVLGTKFTVNRRRDQACVVLLSGKVRVDFDNPDLADIIMKPNELIETHDAQLTVIHKAVHTAPYAGWKDATLVLDETTIAELAARLQDTYGLEVVVQTPELNQRKITGTIPIRDLDVLLLALEQAFHLKASHEGNRIVLSE